MITKYQAHIESLAKEIGCKLVQKPNMPGMMYIEGPEPYIEGPVIVNQIHYLTCLHELAHCKNGDTQGRPPYQDKRAYFDKGVLHCEAAAWDGAIKLCIDEIQPASRYFMWDYCLGSYYTNYIDCAGKPTRLMNGNRHHVKFVYDHPDSYFTSIVKLIMGDITDFKTPYLGAFKFELL
jgi:hypothetical protein